MRDDLFTLIDGAKDAPTDSQAARLPVDHIKVDGVTVTYRPDGSSLSQVDSEYLRSQNFEDLLPIQAIALMGFLQHELLVTRVEAVELLEDGLIRIEEFSPNRKRMLQWFKSQPDDLSTRMLQDWMTQWWAHLKG